MRFLGILWLVFLWLGTFFTGTLRLLGPLIISATIVVMVALANTAIGKIALVAIAGWTLVNIFGIAITDVEQMTTMVSEDPQLAIEYALSWLL